MTPIRALAVVCLVGIGHQGCGGKTADDGGPRVSSGLPPQTPLETLTDAQVRRLCNASAGVVESLYTPERICVLSGFIAALQIDAAGNATVDRATCEQARDECLRDGTPPLSADCETASASDFDGCSATVDEYETCTNASIRETEELLAGVSCSASPSDAEQFVVPRTLPQECDALSEKCPELFFGDNGTERPPPSESGCDDTCIFASDDECDDGGPSAITNFCGLGTDCTDCGPR